MKSVLKKFLSMFITLFVVSFLAFAAFAVIPGDPALMRLKTNATPEAVEALRHSYGLDRPFLTRYFSWVSGLLMGDMGTSYTYSAPVSEIIRSKLMVTLYLTALAFVIMTLISIPVAVHCAKNDGGLTDRVISAVNQVFMSVPPFFAGIIITYIFGIGLRLFVPGGYVPFEDDPAGFIYYMFFPAFAVAIPKIAVSVRLLKSTIMKESKKDYVRTAYSRGERGNTVLYRHVIWNAMIPAVTFYAMQFVDMIAGSIITEQVFSIPGLGRILLTSIEGRDYPVVLAVLMCVAVAAVIADTVSDLGVIALDPRIRE
ncbi:MAG: ABC transporter permease [Lachnospiraceae bacterium]|nr:ABC transporter permease [Lachnospiraceae bacterium]